MSGVFIMRVFQRIELIATLLMLSSICLNAQDNYTPKIADPLLEPWRYTLFTDLSSRSVKCVSKNSETNHYWFGIANGIAQYDGIEWKFYDEKHGLEGGAVTQIHIDKKQDVYASTSKGVFVLKEDKWHNLFKNDGDDDFEFHSIRSLSDGSIFCAMATGALLITDNETFFFSSPDNAESIIENHPEFTFIKLPEDASFNGEFDEISDIFEFNAGLIWMAITHEDEGEIMEFYLREAMQGQITNYKLIGNANQLKLGKGQKFFRDNQNQIWIINKSNNIGILKYYKEQWNTYSLNHQFGDDEYAVSITQSFDNTIWIGSIGKIYSLRNNEWKKYKAPEYNIPSAHILTNSDFDDELCVLGYQSNVLRIDLSHQQWLTYLDLNYQDETSAGHKWFLDVNGQAIYNEGGKWQAFDRHDGLIEKPVRLFVTSQDQVWAFGSDNNVAAIAYLKNNKWHKMHFDSLSWGVDYRAVFEADDGSLWFGGSVDRLSDKGQAGGLIQIKNPLSDKKEWVHYKYRERGLQQSNVYGIGQTKDGNIWIGGGKVYKFDGNEWIESDKENLQQFVNILYSDDSQNLLIGSRYYGLYVFDNNEWTHHSTKNGLLNNTIISIGNKNEEIWLATDKDISYYNGQQWINDVFPTEMNLTYEGGSIKISDNNEIWINISLREWKRRAYTKKPLSKAVRNTFKVYRRIPDDQPPNTSFLVHSEEVDNAGNTFISWKGKDFLYKTPEKDLLYSYKLNDGKWSRFTSQTNETFTGLKDGLYSFKVRSMDLDGNIDPTPAQIQFEVLPPVWKQAWFILLIICFVGLIFVFEYRVISKNKILSKLNSSLQDAVDQLELKKQKIEKQNAEITKHKIEVEKNNKLLESKNHEIETQRDSLKDLVVKIENLSKAKVRFFTNITHEFRTPLSLILGPLETLTSKNVDPSEQSMLFQIIRRNALRLQKLINQLLEIRRIETGTLELMLRKENIVQFVRDIKELYDNQSIQKNIKFSFSADTSDHQMFFDQDKIEKILFNLLSNAFKYTNENGEIQVNITTNPDNGLPESDLKDYIKLQVKDTGKGINPERLENIFERFKNADNDVISNIPSTGIGLSYIKDLVEFHGGKITIKSQPGKGTCFTILIPNNLTPSKSVDISLDKIKPKEHIVIDNSSRISDNLISFANSAHENTASLNTLLIVEDNEDMLLYLNNLLSDKYNIITARDGKEGLAKLSELEIDLVISDIMMPEIDGITFCSQVKSSFETSHIPVLLLTAKNMKASEISGYESGAEDYITKPFNPEILKLKVRNILDNIEKLKARFSQEFKLKPKDVNITSADETLINKMVELMEKHISDPEFDVDKMAEMVNLSHIHFIRKVRQLTGKKPGELLKSFRMQRAKQLLDKNKLNISEIAYMVGYELPNSFSRAFKKEFGVTPSEYTNTIQENIYE